MRVLVELLDREPIENVLSPCIFKPDIVIYLCDTRDKNFFKESAIYRVFKYRKLKTQPRFYYFDATDPAGIRRILLAVARDYPGCVFDFSGGRDLLLLTAGSCSVENKWPGFFIDVLRESFINVQLCEEYAARFAIPNFTAEEIFAMSGATIHGYGHFPQSKIDAAFEADVLAVFPIVCANPRAWGEFVSWLQAFCSGIPSSQLVVSGHRWIKGNHTKSGVNPVLLRRLLEVGALTHCEVSRSRVELTFKSSLMRKCLLVEGVWLELYGYVLARRSGAFSDVRTSIVVDWDGVDGGYNNAKNEVDIFLVRGATPVFISCKMSMPTALAMSEIKLLSMKFGGSYSRTVILTAARLTQDNKAIKARAKDLGIVLLDRTVLEDGSLIGRLQQLAGPELLPEQPKLVDSTMLPPLK